MLEHAMNPASVAALHRTVEGAAPVRPAAPVPARPVVAGEAAGDPAVAAGQAEAARRAAEAASRALAEKGHQLAFEFDDTLGRVIVRLIDTQTGEVVRQVPSPEVLQIARALRAAEGDARGVLLNAAA